MIVRRRRRWSGDLLLDVSPERNEGALLPRAIFDAAFHSEFVSPTRLHGEAQYAAHLSNPAHRP